MNSNKPFTITSSGHALAVSVYAFQSFIGGAVVFGLGHSNALSNTLGVGVMAALATVMLLAGLTAVISIISLTVSSRPPTTMLVAELVAASLIGLVNIALLLALIGGYGSGSAVTQGYAAAIGLGCLARVVQIVRDLRRYRKALEHPVWSDAMLAEPHN